MYRSSDGGRTWAHSASRDTQQIGRILVDPTRPRPRLRRGARPPLRPERRARRLPLARRRRALGEGARPGRGHRRGRPRLRARQPAGGLCLAVADAAAALERLPAVQRPGQRAVEVDRRRRPLGASSPATACPRRRAASASRSRRRAAARLRSSSTPAPRPATAASTAPTTAAPTSRRTSSDTRVWQRGWYFGRHHRRSQRTPTWSTRSTRRATLARRRQDLRAGRRATPPATTTTSCGSTREHPERRILGVDQGADRHGQRRRDVELVAQPADRADLPREHRRPFPLLGLRRAAGLRRGGRAEPHHRARRHHHAAVPRGHRRRRERHDRARPATTRRSSTAAASTSSTCAPDRPARSTRRSPIPTITTARLDAAARVLAARPDASLYFAQPAPLPHRRRRRALDGDQPRPDARGSRRRRRTSTRRRRPTTSASGRGAASSTPSRPRAPRWRHLGRHRRRQDLAHPRRGRALERRHAGGARRRGRRSASSSPRRFDAETAYAAIDRHRLDDFAPVRLPHPRRRRQLADGRRPASRTQLRQRRARGPGAPRACSTPAPRRASTSRSTTARPGSRCSSGCR